MTVFGWEFSHKHFLSSFVFLISLIKKLNTQTLKLFLSDLPHQCPSGQSCSSSFPSSCGASFSLSLVIPVGGRRRAMGQPWSWAGRSDSKGLLWSFAWSCLKVEDMGVEKILCYIYSFSAATNLPVFSHSLCPRVASLETAIFLHGSIFAQLIPSSERVTGCHEMTEGRNTSGATFPSRHASESVTGAQFFTMLSSI